MFNIVKRYRTKIIIIIMRVAGGGRGEEGWRERAWLNRG